ncbi:MAG: helix-turn-helix domain-containing protein [Alphaproteobacteria bacterium]|nr:helix-turn-helix domain-containing protein [Alphaproteobacteria bacterium]
MQPDIAPVSAPVSGRYIRPHLPHPLGIIAQHTSFETALRVAEVLGGRRVRIPDNHHKLTLTTEGVVLARLVGAAAAAICDDVHASANRSRGLGCTWEIPHAPEAWAIALIEDGVSIPEVAHRLKKSQRAVRDYINRHRKEGAS